MDVLSISEPNVEALLLKFPFPSYFIYKETGWERFRVRSGHTCVEAGEVRKGSTTSSCLTETLEKSNCSAISSAIQRNNCSSSAVDLDIPGNCIQLIPCLIFLTNNTTSSWQETCSGAGHAAREVFLTDTNKPIDSYCKQLISAVFCCIFNM